MICHLFSLPLTACLPTRCPLCACSDRLPAALWTSSRGLAGVGWWSCEKVVRCSFAPLHRGSKGPKTSTDVNCTALMEHFEKPLLSPKAPHKSRSSTRTFMHQWVPAGCKVLLSHIWCNLRLHVFTKDHQKGMGLDVNRQPFSHF